MGRSIRGALLGLLAALATAAAAATAASAIAAPVLPLAHAGRWITDARGRAVIVHGTAMVMKVAPYYPAAAGFGDDDAAFLHEIGLNAVRVGVIWKAVEPAAGRYDDGYLDQIAATVATLARHGVLSLLDFHQDLYNERFQGEGAPDWAVQSGGLPSQPMLGFPYNYFANAALWRANDNFWSNSPGPGGVGLADRFAAAWRHVAQRFRAVRGLLGYELYNEPFPGTPYLTCGLPSGCPGFDAELTAVQRKVTREIRAVDGRTLVWYEPNVIFNFGFVTDVGALNDGEAGFAFHDYCLTPASAGCSTLAKPFNLALAHVDTTGEALLASEFHADTGTIELADEHLTPWLEWAYCLCRDPTTTQSKPVVEDPAKPPAGANLGLAALAAIVEPYPQVLAGTPVSYAYDRASRRFTLRYLTRRPDGRGSFGRYAVTEIAAPGFDYPHGYAVRAVGAAITSKRGAGTLTVAACPGASSIAVTIAPAGASRGSCRLPRDRRRRR